MTSTHRQPVSAPTPGRGEAGLRRKMRIDPDIRARSITGGVLWIAAAAIGLLQQFGPAGEAMPHRSFSVYLGFTVVMALLCLIGARHLPERIFMRAEDVVVTAGWGAIAFLVAFTGGATSPDMALFASVMFYVAYFMRPRRAAAHVLVGTLAMWAPLIYDSASVASSGFVARAFVMSVVFLAVVVLIASNCRMMRRAELRARRLALTDPLTGVANLHTFNGELERALRRAGRRDQEFGVAFVDVNGLKAANTVHGHAGGDDLIRRTAAALVAAAGREDQVARIGGDEFAVLVSGADRGRMDAYERDFALALTEQGRHAGAGQGLSASIGTAVHPADGDTRDELMRVADERMYDSKAALPQRLPTPGTAGGRKLDESPDPPEPRLQLLRSGVPAGAIAWLIAGVLIAVTPSFHATTTNPRLALALGAFSVAVGGLLGIVEPGTRRATLAARVSTTFAVLLAAPVIIATGGVATPLLPLAYLVVADAAHARSLRGFLLPFGAVSGMLLVVLAASFGADSSTETTVVVGQAFLLALMLRYNRRRMLGAERAALELSRTDALTKLANRRVFERVLSRAVKVTDVARAEGGYDRGGLILTDVDDFKLINTAGGHRTGDEVLRMIAAVLEGTIGSEGTVCRIGGDEFAVIVPSGDAASLARTVEKTRAAIGAVDWHVLSAAPVTLSFGSATWEGVEEWKDIVVAADIELRMRKRQRREQEVVETTPQRRRRIGPDEAQGPALAG